MATGTLDDKLIARIALRLTWPNMCQISVKYMGFDYGDLERIWFDEMKATPSTREALTLYRSKLSEEQSHTAKERLIFYLNDSGLVDQNIIKQILGTTDKQFDRLQPEIQKTISTQVLGELATEISTSSMETGALGWLGLSNGEVKATKYDSFRKSWLFNLGILELYSTKPGSSLQDLKDKLMKSAKEGGYVDGGKVAQILNKEIESVHEHSGNDAEDDEGENVYPMNTTPKGHMLIFNNKTFPDHERKGTDKDRDQLTQVFGKFGIVAEVVESPTAQKMKEKMKKFAERDDLNNASCAVVAFLSHGENGKIKGCDNEYVELKPLISELLPLKCPALYDKPKLCLIEACRGDSWGVHTDSETDTDDDMLDADHDKKLKENLPTFPDLLVGFATCAGKYAGRNEASGSYFIQEFCRVVSEHAGSESIIQMTSRINRLTAEASRQKQMSEWMNKLTKEWKLVKT